MSDAYRSDSSDVGGGMIGSRRNDSSTIRATPSASGEERSSLNFSINSSARSDEENRGNAGLVAAVPAPEVAGTVAEPSFGTAVVVSRTSSGTPSDAAKSFARFRPEACSCYLAQSGRERSVKSWHGWPARLAPIPSHNENHGSLSISSSMASILKKWTADELKHHFSLCLI